MTNMKRKNTTFICLSAVMCVIVCLQLVNHFVMLKGTESECICSCAVAAPQETPVDEKGEDHPQSPLENEKRFDGNLNEMLELLGNMNEVQQNLFGDRYEQLLELLSSVKEKRDAANNEKLTEETVRSEQKAQPAEIQEICPEKFMGESLTYGYPFFRKGFATLNCSQHIPIHDLVTLLFDDLHTSNQNPPAYKRVLNSLSKYHPKMKVVYITRDTPGGVEGLKSNVTVINVKEEINQGKIWSKALAHVTTKYVLIAPHLMEFDDDINLKRLVRILSHNPDVAIVSGAYRTRNGHWDIGCQQSRFLNYTLTLQGGYYMSFWECLVCDFTPGPWLARTKDLEVLKFDEG